ncbi:sensory rhodopsin transducer [Natronorubrum halophilum]|nr:sensory rhodopsin transducer [Natronorubrum halophilum]
MGDFARVIESDIPIGCQHTRLGSRRGENALLTLERFQEYISKASPDFE